MAEAPEETGRRGSGGRLCFNAIARLHSWRPQHATDGEAPGACDSVRFLLLLFDCSIWTGPSASSPRGDGRRNLRRSLETLKMRSMLGGSCFLERSRKTDYDAFIRKPLWYIDNDIYIYIPLFVRRLQSCSHSPFYSLLFSFVFLSDRFCSPSSVYNDHSWVTPEAPSERSRANARGNRRFLRSQAVSRYRAC